MRAFRLAYDGAPFRGFQRQPDVPTVEGTLLRALASLEVVGVDGSLPAGYAAAGRTDAGVSALAQTVAFECPDWCSPAALNGTLPESVRAWASADAPADFHATRDARRRTYVYHLHAPEADDDRLERAARRLSGEHDFANLTADSTNTARRVAIDCSREGAFVAVRVSAGGFPRQLVRRLATVLADVGEGARTLADVEALLGDTAVTGAAGVAPAPAHALLLADVEYDLDFEVDPDAVASARSAFRSRRVEHAARACVAGGIVGGL